jgi:hypothetical protein
MGHSRITPEPCGFPPTGIVPATVGTAMLAGTMATAGTLFALLRYASKVPEIQGRSGSGAR